MIEFPEASADVQTSGFTLCLFISLFYCFLWYLCEISYFGVRTHYIHTRVFTVCVCICIYFYFFYYIYATYIWRHTYGSVMHWGVIRAPTQKHKEVLVWMLCKIRDAICETHTRTHCNYMFFWKAEPLYIVSGRNETCESVNLQLRPYNYITSWQTLHCLPHMASTVKKNSHQT